MNSSLHYSSPNEVNQSYVRTTNTTLILLYLVIYAYLSAEQIFVSYTIFSLLYLLFTLPLYLWSLRCVKLPYSSFERHGYRISGLTGDIIFLSIAISFAEEGGTPLFFVYLWIIVGNGIRYGSYYLIISTCISVVCFTVVILTTDVWRTAELFPIAIGLLISLLILPAYIQSLIKRLSIALDAEKIANQAKQTFLANVNHELRTPLNSIINLTELIQASSLSKKTERMVGMINTSANTQLQIINSILDFTKIEAGEYKLNKNVFSLYGLVRDVYLILLPQAISHKLKLFINIDSKCYEKYIGPNYEIRQILMNLLGNAIKFTEKGYVCLCVDVVNEESTKQKIIFSVKDTGIGISDENQIEIFKPFRQVNSNRTVKNRGTGLGITISKKLSKLMEGDLRLNSTLGKGSIFSLEVMLNYLEKRSEQQNSIQAIYLYNKKLYGSRILNTLINRGINIEEINMAVKNNFNSEIKNKENLIIILEDNAIDLVNFEKIESLALKNIHTIIVTDNKNNINIAFPITQINYNSSPNILNNAISICDEFISHKHSVKKSNPENITPLNILIAEDDPTLQEVNRLLLENTPHKVSIVENGLKALNKLKAENYDVAILDLHMPEMSGIEVAKKYNKISSENNKLLFILQTADTKYIEYNRDNLELFDAVLTKPISIQDLLNTINLLLLKTGNKQSDNKSMIVEDVEEIDSKISSMNSVINYDVIDENIKIVGVDEILNIIEIYDKEVRLKINYLSSTERNAEVNYDQVFHQLKGASSSVGAKIFSDIVTHFSNISDSYLKQYCLQQLINDLENVHNISMLVLRNYLNEKVNKLYL